MYSAPKKSGFLQTLLIYDEYLVANTEGALQRDHPSRFLNRRVLPYLHGRVSLEMGSTPFWPWAERVASTVTLTVWYDMFKIGKTPHQQETRIRPVKAEAGLNFVFAELLRKQLKKTQKAQKSGEASFGPPSGLDIPNDRDFRAPLPSVKLARGPCAFPSRPWLSKFFGRPSTLFGFALRVHGTGSFPPKSDTVLGKTGAWPRKESQNEERTTS